MIYLSTNRSAQYSNNNGSTMIKIILTIFVFLTFSTQNTYAVDITKLNPVEVLKVQSSIFKDDVE